MNLPIIILRDTVFLPYSEIKLEIDNDEGKNIIYTSEYFHKGYILVATTVKNKDNALPNAGVIARIIHKETLSSGNLKVSICGETRAKIKKYLPQTTEILETIVEKQIIKKNQNEDELVSKLKEELNIFIKTVPGVSNSFVSKIENIKCLSNMIDIVINSLNISNKEKAKYLYETDANKRLGLLLNYINKEKDRYNEELEKINKIKENKQEKEEIVITEEEIKEETKPVKMVMPSSIKKKIEQELKRCSEISEISPENGMIKTYIDWLNNIPWNKKTEDTSSLKEVEIKLDETHYSLMNVKTRIIEFLAAKKMNNDLKSPIICLVGPPGVGKTSLAFSIAKALNRKSVKMSVGGISDEGELLGHRRTYLGSRPGKIISLLRKCSSMNPVFLIDEIDKTVSGIAGDIGCALLEVLDPVQNKFFVDNYIEEEVDLSDVLFITTANNIEEIKPELKDRLEIIEIPGYTEHQKLEIVKNYLIKKTLENYKLDKKKITFHDEAIIKIIREYTKEMGIRELDRKISDIVRKVVTDIVINETAKSYVITKASLKKYLGEEIYKIKDITADKQIGIVNSLAYTNLGGTLMPIEVNYFKGKGDLILTGTLGNVIKESAKIALSYLKANAKHFKIDFDSIINSDIHIHIPEGDLAKDGPSAGIVIATSLVSSFSKLGIPENMAFTGEITLSGKVLPVGKIEEKIMAAIKNRIKTIIVPADNMPEIKKMPSVLLKNIEIKPVKDYKEVYKEIKPVRQTRKKNTKEPKNA